MRAGADRSYKKGGKAVHTPSSIGLCSLDSVHTPPKEEVHNAEDEKRFRPS